MEGLIATARGLANTGPTRPRQADPRRAISTAYYALFHALAQDAADLLVGAKKSGSIGAWVQAYRALDHNTAKTACEVARSQGFSAALCSCADTFVDLQKERHSADYDPLHRVKRGDAMAAIELAEQAIRDLKSAPRGDRTAFAIHLLLKRRR